MKIGVIGDGSRINSGTGVAKGLDLGSLGMRLEGISVEDILENAEFYADLLEKHSAIGFKRLHPTKLEQVAINKALYRGGETVGEPGFGLLSNLDHSGLRTKQNEFKEAFRSKEESEAFVSLNWHVDLAFRECPNSYQSIHMTRYENVIRGETILVSLEHLYNICPPEFKEFLQDKKIMSGTGNTKEGGVMVEHPALRTHPVTGRTCLFFTGPDSACVGNDGEVFDKTFNEYMLWVKEELKKEENRFIWDWNVGDLLIWDNRNLVHSFYGDWEVGDRVFDRMETGYSEKPFYDPPSEEVEESAVSPVNPDHIPLSFTRGIYGLPDFRHLENSVTLFIVDDELQETEIKLHKEINHPDFHIVPIECDGIWKKYVRYHSSEDTKASRFLFTRNGDLAAAFAEEKDLENEENLCPVPLRKLVPTLLSQVRDLRHAGHAMHYPDWMGYPTQQFRPFHWQNLAFIKWEQFDSKKGPPVEYLIQFAMDQIYGCFNHFETNEERKYIVEEIRDFLDFILETEEYEIGR